MISMILILSFLLAALIVWSFVRWPETSVFAMVVLLLTILFWGSARIVLTGGL